MGPLDAVCELLPSMAKARSYTHLGRGQACRLGTSAYSKTRTDRRDRLERHGGQCASPGSTAARERCRWRQRLVSRSSCL